MLDLVHGAVDIGVFAGTCEAFLVGFSGELIVESFWHIREVMGAVIGCQ